MISVDTATGRDYRRERYSARHAQWGWSTLKRAKACGRYSVKEGGGVTVRRTVAADGSVSTGYAGLSSCGSVWACPVCSAKISAHRQHELAAAIDAWQGRVAFLTLTMRHHARQPLKRLWDGLSDAWHAATSGRGWTDDQRAWGTPWGKNGRPRIPIIRVVEVTHGVNGWHVHVHALLLLPASAGIDTADHLGASMFSRWRAKLVATGFDAPSDRRGVDVRLVDDGSGLGDYFTKTVYAAKASREVARGDRKSAGRGNRTPFAILESMVTTRTTGEVRDEAQLLEVDRDGRLWAEWEQASRGRRQITWTHGLRAALLPEPEMTDEEVAEQDQGGEDTCYITRDQWTQIAARHLDYQVLAAFARDVGEGRALVNALAPPGY